MIKVDGGGRAMIRHSSSKTYIGLHIHTACARRAVAPSREMRDFCYIGAKRGASVGTRTTTQRNSSTIYRLLRCDASDSGKTTTDHPLSHEAALEMNECKTIETTAVGDGRSLALSNDKRSRGYENVSYV